MFLAGNISHSLRFIKIFERRFNSIFLEGESSIPINDTYASPTLFPIFDNLIVFIV